MIDRKEVELLVRAQLKGGRDIQSITKSIADLEKAIDSQADAAKRGEAAYDGLKAAANALKGIQEELAGRSNLTRQFQQVTKQVDAQSAAVEKAQEKLKAYQATLSGDRSDAEQKKVQKLTAAYQQAQARLEQFKRSQETFGAALREAGVNLDNLADEQRQVQEQQLANAAATNRLNRELEQYTVNVSKAREAAKRLADEQAKLARLEAGNAADARLAADQIVKRNRRIEQSEADRLATLEKFGRSQQAQAGQAQASSELAAIRDSEEFLRQYTEAKRKAAAQDAGLQKTADEAERTARSFTTLARGSKDLTPRVTTLRDVLRGIVDPAGEVRKTLDGVEKEVQDLKKAIDSAKGPVVDYASQFKKLEEAQKAMAGQASLIDNFRKQNEALRNTRTALVEARQQVATYAAEVRKGGDAGAAFVKPLADAQLRLKAAAAALREQIAATRDARASLTAAGIGASNLAQAEQRLVGSTRDATAAMKTLTEAAERNGHAVRTSGQGFGIFRDEGRTTLSMAQRLKGEILALATAYFGVQGAISLATDSLKAFTQQQGLQSSLAFALGDPKAVGQETDYVRTQADRLGISLEQSGKGYAKFAAAAVKSGASVGETRFIFEAFAETARVINLTPDELNGLFNAIGQSFSKGKIQAEELRQQIGERLPGAFAFAQEALKSKFPDLNKALEEGKVGAENMLLIAESVRKAASGQLPQAIKSLDAEQQRFNNSVLQFKIQIAEAGFAEAYIKMLQELTTYLKSTDGQEFAKALAEVGIAFTNGVRFIVEYRDELKTLLLVFAALMAGGLLARVGTAVATLGPALLTAAVNVRTLAGAFQFLAGVIGAFFAGFAIGDYLRDQFQSVRVAGIVLVRNIMEMMAHIKYLFKSTFSEDFPTTVQNGFKEAINKATYMGRKLLEVWARIFSALGNEKVAGAITALVDELTLKPQTTKAAQELQAELAKIRDITRDMMQEEFNLNPRIKVLTDDPGAKQSDRKFDQPARMPSVRTPDTPVDDAAAKKREAEIDRINKALEQLDAKALKKQDDSLQAQIDAAKLQYADLGRDIAKLGGDAGRGFAERFKNGMARLEEEIRQDFNAKLLKEQETLLGKLEQLDAQAGRKAKDDLEARQEAIRTSQGALFRDIAALRDRMLQAGQSTDLPDGLRDRAEAAIKELQVLEKQKYLKEQLQEQEKRINDLVNARSLAIKRVQEQVIAGELTPGQGDTQAQAIIGQMQPQMTTAIEQARQFALANAAAFDPIRLQEFLLLLQQVANSGNKLNVEFDRTKQIIDSGIGKSVDGAFNALYESIGKVTQGVGDWGDVFDNVAKSILQGLADILKELAMAYLKEQALIAIAVIRKAVSAGVAHEGAIVGHSSPTRSRQVSASWFVGAPRYHTGGFAGLAPDEYPAILQKNEEVLTESDPRNALNGGLSLGKGEGTAMNARFVIVDDQRRVAEAMASAEGEQVFMAHARKNIPTLRQLIKG